MHQVLSRKPLLDSCSRFVLPSRAVRLARNIAEKQRRDKVDTASAVRQVRVVYLTFTLTVQLNGYINELANAVPLVATASKRLDKTSILRLSAAYLRLHNSKCGQGRRVAAGRRGDARRDTCILAVLVKLNREICR